MKKHFYFLKLLLVLCVVGCGNVNSNSGLTNSPTPTPLPTPIIPEKPQYTVQRGTVVNALTFNGRVSPVMEASLAFETSGIVNSVDVAQGDDVVAGSVLATLDVSTPEKAVSDAEQALIEAQRNLATAEDEHTEKLLQAEIGLQKMILADVDSNTATNGLALLDKQRAVEDAQANVDSLAQAYQTALSDPNSEQATIDSLSQSLERAEQDLLIAQTNLNDANSGGGGNSATKELDRIEAERAYLQLLEGIGPELEWAVEKAERDLEEARGALQNAQLVAPFDGRILSVSTRRGNQAEPFKTVMVIAQLDALEVTANLNAAELEKLSIGQSAQVVLLNQTGEGVEGTIRTLPYPYSGGSGDADNDEKVVRIRLVRDDNLVLGELAEVTITLQAKEDVLWLPPAAIRQFQGRNFVVVQREEGQQRVDVRLGIESVDRVEILEGVEAGQIIVGE